MKKVALATSMTELPIGDQLLARALAKEGFDVCTVIWSMKRDWREFDLVIVRSCWDYHLRIQQFLDWIALLESSGVAVVNAPDLIRWNSDKVYLAEVAASGIAIPDTIFVEPGMELELAEVCASRGWRTAVVKPTVSAGATGTKRRTSGVVNGPAIVQEYIGSIQTEGEWSLMYFNGHMSHAVIKRPRTKDFRVQADFGGTVEAAEPNAEMLTFSDAVVDRLPRPALFSRVDVIATNSGIRLMELEVIEPNLFLELMPGSEQRLAAEFKGYILANEPAAAKSNI